MSIHGYPKIWHLGHKAVDGMFTAGKVYVQEKYDGSQFSFTKDIDTGELRFRSRRVELDPDNMDSLFEPTVAHLLTVKDSIVSGWVYRGEAFKSNRHNTKKYGRIPKGHFVLFDVDVGHQAFIKPEETQKIADRLGVEQCRLLAGILAGLLRENPKVDDLQRWLDLESSLGETKVEGVVFKNYDFFTPYGHPAMAKFVSEEFKEEHKKNVDWKQGKDLFDALGSTFATEARWRKGVQRLRDEGKLEGTPRDIGVLLKELSVDLLEEYGDELKERVWKDAWKRISKAANRGFPEWYKRELAFGLEGSGGVGGGDDEDNG